MKITLVLVLVVELCAAPVRSHCTFTFLLLNKRARKKKKKSRKKGARERVKFCTRC